MSLPPLFLALVPLGLFAERQPPVARFALGCGSYPVLPNGFSTTTEP